MVLWDSNRRLKEAGDYIFSSGYSTEASAEIAADYALQKLHLKRFAVVGHTSPAVQIFSDTFSKRVLQAKGQILYRQLVPSEITDFKVILPGIKKVNPDGVYFLFFPPFSGTFLKQAAELKIKAQFLTADLFTGDAVNIAGGKAEGVYFTNIYAEQPEVVSAEYQAKYGTKPLEVSLVALGYDGLLKVGQALPVLPSAKTMQQALLQVFGPTRSVERREKLYRVVNGRALEVK